MKVSFFWILAIIYFIHESEGQTITLQLTSESIVGLGTTSSPWVAHSSKNKKIYSVLNSNFRVQGDTTTTTDATTKIITNAFFLALSPDESRVVVISSTGDITLFDAGFTNNTPLNTYSSGITDTTFVAFNSNSNKLVTSHSGSVGIRIWTITGDVIQSPTALSSVGDIQKALFHPTDDLKIIAIKSKKTINLYDYSKGTSSVIITKIYEHTLDISDIIINSKATKIAFLTRTTSSASMTNIALIDISTNSKLWEVGGYMAIRIAFTINENLICAGYTFTSSGTTYTTVKFIDVTSGTTSYVSDVTGRTSNSIAFTTIGSIFFSSDNKGVAVTTVNGGMRFFKYKCNCATATKCAFPFKDVCCDSTCLTCFGSTATTCTSCDTTSSTNAWYFSKDNTCLSDCPSSTYKITDKKLCADCSSQCLTCSGPLTTDCNSCLKSSANHGWYYTDTKTCQSDCSSVGYYVVSPPSDKICSPCNSNCYTCDGALDTNCLSCEQSLTNLNWYWADRKSCYTSCPSAGSYISNSITKQCSSCDPTCGTCEGSAANQCLTCDSSKQTDWFLTNTKTCVDECPTKSYQSNINSKFCTLCHSSCLTCDGITSIDCLSCDTGIADFSYYFIAKKTCNPSCPEGSYSAGGFTCGICHSKCKTCSGPLENNCLTSYIMVISFNNFRNHYLS
jgi:hypothetical protein